MRCGPEGVSQLKRAIRVAIPFIVAALVASACGGVSNCVGAGAVISTVGCVTAGSTSSASGAADDCVAAPAAVCVVAAIRDSMIL